MNNYVMDDSGVIETQFRDIVTLKDLEPFPSKSACGQKISQSCLIPAHILRPYTAMHEYSKKCA